MFNNSGYTMPVAPITYSNGGGMFGGDSDWLALIVLFALFGGWGGNGMFGGFGGNRGCGEPCATQSDVRAAVDQQTLISKLDQQTYGLADSTYALNNAITGGFNGVQSTLCQGFNGVDRAIADCCCGTQRALERGFADTNYNMATQSCEIKQAINDSTKSVIDFLVSDKLATLQAENQNLKLKASQAEQNNFIAANQQAQTAELIRRLGADCPVPAYVVPNPNCCYNPLGFNFSSGCGCGCA